MSLRSQEVEYQYVELTKKSYVHSVALEHWFPACSLPRCVIRPVATFINHTCVMFKLPNNLGG